MSDLQRFKDLLRDFGVEYSEDTGEPSIIRIQIEAMKGEVEGYFGFYTVLTFNALNGCFMNIGIWE